MKTYRIFSLVLYDNIDSFVDIATKKVIFIFT